MPWARPGLRLGRDRNAEGSQRPLRPGEFGIRHHRIGVAVNQQHRRARVQLARKQFRARRGRPEYPTTAAGVAARRKPTKRDIMAPWENPTKARSRSVRPRAASASSMKASRIAAAALVPARICSGERSLEAEPLPAEAAHLAGERCVRRKELGIGQLRRPMRCQRDQIVAVGAVAVQQQHQALGPAAGQRRLRGAGQIEWSGHEALTSLRRAVGVVMPKQARCNAAPGPPGLAHAPELRFLRSSPRSLRQPRRLAQRQVARRQHVGPLQAEHEIDLRRPAADALQLRQLDQHVLVGQPGKALEVEPPLGRRLGQAAGVDHLLPAEADGGEVGLAECEQALGRDAAHRGQKPLGNGTVGRGRDLLGQHDVDQGGKAGGPRAGRRRPHFREDTRQVAVLAGQRPQRRREPLALQCRLHQCHGVFLPRIWARFEDFSSPASPPARRAGCIWAMPIRRSWLTAWRAKRAGDSCCASRTSIRNAAGRPSRLGSTRISQWLGLGWELPVRRQSEHAQEYRAALDRLAEAGFLYPCFCSRKAIQAEIARAVAAPHGAEGPPYPGTCRALPRADRAARIAAGKPYALRLDVGRALAATGPLAWHDFEKGTVQAEPQRLGDVVLGRRDAPASYHLAVTLDDHLQGVSLVTRGEDLFEATHIHCLLQALLGLEPPDYRHHRLLTNDRGERLSKRDGGAGAGRAARSRPDTGRSSGLGRVPGLRRRPNCTGHWVNVAASPFDWLRVRPICLMLMLSLPGYGNQTPI